MPEIQTNIDDVYLRLRRHRSVRSGDDPLTARSLVIGGGVYGVACARYALGLGHRCAIVDPDPACRARAVFGKEGTSTEVDVIVGGIPEALAFILSTGPALIFPTAPLHVCAALVEEETGMAPADPAPVLARLPPDVIVSSGGGSVVLSYNRDGRCLPSCAAPEVCPVTGRRRPVPLSEMLAAALPDAAILRSRQCAPGIGALSGSDVLALLERASRTDRIVVGTACRCHGVATALERKKV